MDCYFWCNAPAFLPSVFPWVGDVIIWLLSHPLPQLRSRELCQEAAEWLVFREEVRQCGSWGHVPTSCGTVYNPQGPIRSRVFDFPLNYWLLLCGLILKKNREGLIPHKHLSVLPYDKAIRFLYNPPTGISLAAWCVFICLVRPLWPLAAASRGFCQLLISLVMLKPIQATYMLVKKESHTNFIAFFLLSDLLHKWHWFSLLCNASFCRHSKMNFPGTIFRGDHRDLD